MKRYLISTATQTLMEAETLEQASLAAIRSILGAGHALRGYTITELADAQQPNPSSPSETVPADGSAD